MNKNHFLMLTASAVVVSYSMPSIPSLSVASNVYATNAVKFDNSSQANFVTSIAPYAKDLAERKDLYASIMIAQAVLESASGTSDLAKIANNLFGVKEKNGGPFVLMPSKEFIDGKEKIVESPFKVFESQLQSLEYYTGHFTQTPWYTGYYKGVHRSESSSYQEALKVLDGKYATDPAYIQKLQTLIDRYNLTQHDVPSGLPENQVEDPNQEEKPSNNNGSNPIQPPKDTTAPGEVSGLKTTVAVDKITLNFTKPKDSDFSHVVVLRNGAIVAKKATTTSYTDSGLKENTKYTYTIQTVDKSGNASKGTSISATTSKKIVESATYYTVQKKDTLSSIARKYNTTYQKIMTLNNLKTTTIKIGQKLKVSGTPSTVTPIPTPAPPVTKPVTKPVTTPTPITTTTKTGKVTASTLNMRSGAGTSYKVVTTLKKNITVTVNSVSGKWAYVTYGSKKGYVSTDYLVITTKTSSVTTPNQTPTNNKVAVVPSNTTSVSHTVKSGDTLYAISKKYNTSVATIKTWNKLSSNAIKIGQKLVVKK